MRAIVRIIKLVSLLLAVLLINSCAKAEKEDALSCVPEMMTYGYDFLLLSIQDASGIDLLKGIDFDRWWPDSIPKEEADNGRIINDYTLDFVFFPDPLMNPYETLKIYQKRYLFIPDNPYPELWVLKWGGYYCLYFQFDSNRSFDDKIFPPADKITIKLRCPYIFGDNMVHEIETYWKSWIPIEDAHPNSYQSFCYRVAFDGKEYTPYRFPEIPEPDNYPYYQSATLILER